MLAFRARILRRISLRSYSIAMRPPVFDKALLEAQVIEMKEEFSEVITKPERAVQYFKVSTINPQKLNELQKYHYVINIYESWEQRFLRNSVPQTLLTEEYLYAKTCLGERRDHFLDHIETGIEQRIKQRLGKNPDPKYFVNEVLSYAKFTNFLWLMAYGFFIYNCWRNYQDVNKYEIVSSKDIKERLDDVKGLDEVKGEIKELIHMIKHRKKYAKKGAKITKGVLLSGAPGTGKTMIARAIAKESGAVFIYQSGSTFDEGEIGRGSKSVRDLFEHAKRRAKFNNVIIFIDEADSLFSKSRRQFESTSSRATLNEFLTRLDGFNQSQGITVIAATNFPEQIDKAAVRAGRFDLKIQVPLPDQNGRESIFQHYLKQVKYNKKEIEAKKMAQMTPGFTGADVKNLVNTAISEAVHREKKEASLEEFEYARDRIMMGIERKNLTMTQQQRFHTALHEAGHAIACYFTPGARKLYKATIVSRGSSLGATFMVPNQEDTRGINKEKLIAMIDVAMGGHVAEIKFIGEGKLSSGAGSDLAHATSLAKQGVRKFSMFQEKFSLLQSDAKEVSDDVNNEIDQAVKQVLSESHERVTRLLGDKQEELRRLAKALYEFDYLDDKEIDAVISGDALKKEKVREFKLE